MSLVTTLEATEIVFDFRCYLDTAVDFRKWLRFPRGAAGASSATPVGSPPSAISLRSLRLLLLSTARNHLIHEISVFQWPPSLRGLNLPLPPSGVSHLALQETGESFKINYVRGAV